MSHACSAAGSVCIIIMARKKACEFETRTHAVDHSNRHGQHSHTYMGSLPRVRPGGLGEEARALVKRGEETASTARP